MSFEENSDVFKQKMIAILYGVATKNGSSELDISLLIEKIHSLDIEQLTNILPEFVSVFSEYPTQTDIIIKGEFIYSQLKPEFYEKYRGKYIVIDTDTWQIVFSEETRTKAHEKFIQENLSPNKYYLRKVDIAPLVMIT